MRKRDTRAPCHFDTEDDDSDDDDRRYDNFASQQDDSVDQDTE